MRAANWACALALGAAMVVLVGSTGLWANAPAPRFRPAPPVEPKLTAAVTVEHKELEPGVRAVVRIPAALVARLGAVQPALGLPPGSAPGAAPSATPAPRSATPAGEKQSALPYGGTLIAGFALSLAAVSLVLVLRRGPTTRLLGGLCLALVIAAVAASAVLADIRIPGQPYRGPARRPNEAPVPAEQITIEVVPEGDTVTLILPAEKKPR